jgi:hypothetical protein
MFSGWCFFLKTNTSTKSIILLLTVCKAIEIQNKSFKQSQSYFWVRQHIAWWSNLHDRLSRIRSYLWPYFTTFKKLWYILPHLSKSRATLNLLYFSLFLCHTGHHLSFHFWTYLWSKLMMSGDWLMCSCSFSCYSKMFLPH